MVSISHWGIIKVDYASYAALFGVPGVIVYIQNFDYVGPIITTDRWLSKPLGQ